MNRRKFIRTGCTGCLAAGWMSFLLESCSSSAVLSAGISGSDMIVPLREFKIKNSQGGKFKKFLVLQNDLLQYPICVYRLDEKKYEAIWMKCSHQGAELQVFGDTLQCPAHGSEFNQRGEVESGPASEALRVFPITVQDDHLLISLR